MPDCRQTLALDVIEKRLFFWVLEVPEAEIVVIDSRHFCRSFSAANETRQALHLRRCAITRPEVSDGALDQSGTAHLLERANVLLRSARLTGLAVKQVGIRERGAAFVERTRLSQAQATPTDVQSEVLLYLQHSRSGALCAQQATC
jgi:hypothetical protein